MSLGNDILLTMAGVVILVIVFYDVYGTILRATKQPGLLSTFLNRGLWWLATCSTYSLNRRCRHRILLAIGPLLMPLLIASFILMLITGFALIYLPRMETGFKVEDTARGSKIVQAYYFSGVTFLTISYSDILPVSNLMRIFALIEGAAGLAIISPSITYLLTVYGALDTTC